jgi:hypothetical protein
MHIDLTRLPLVHSLLRNRWPQLIITSVALAGFVIAILAGWLGTPVGSRNFSIIFVWIAWWAILILAVVPFFGRGWCSICPIPAPGEWLQRGALLGPAGKGLGSSLRWPNKLRNIWLQNGAFLLLALFSLTVLTQPRVTAILLAGLLFLAIGTSLVFERRAFCRYLCPVGGFIGLYAQLAPLEVRVRDTSVCAAHQQKTCYTGSAEGYGCPWQVFPGSLVKNTSCGLCMECLRTCPHENVAIQIRPFGADLYQTGGRSLDEIYKAFIMLGSALLYSAVLLGPWGGLKAAANAIGSLPWLLYALSFLIITLAALPGLFWLAVRLGMRLSGSSLTPRKAFRSLAYCLVPLGLSAWAAFSVAFVFSNFSYLWPVLSDPFGWGWNLLGTAQLAWTPYLSGAVPALQAAILLAGFAWSVHVVCKIAAESLPERPALLQALPVSVFNLGITLGLLVLLVG